MYSKKPKLPNLLRSISLVSIFLFGNLFICCDCNNSFLDDDKKEANITLTSEYGSRTIETSNLVTDRRINNQPGFLFKIKISSKDDGGFTLEDLESVSCKIKNKENVDEVMYVSSGIKIGYSVTTTGYATIYHDSIDLKRLLTVLELSRDEAYPWVTTTMVAIPKDKSKPCTFTLELEVDGKSIEESVNVTCKSSSHGGSGGSGGGFRGSGGGFRGSEIDGIEEIGELIKMEDVEKDYPTLTKKQNWPKLIAQYEQIKKQFMIAQTNWQVAKAKNLSPAEIAYHEQKMQQVKHIHDYINIRHDHMNNLEKEENHKKQQEKGREMAEKDKLRQKSLKQNKQSLEKAEAAAKKAEIASKKAQHIAVFCKPAQVTATKAQEASKKAQEAKQKTQKAVKKSRDKANEIREKANEGSAEKFTPEETQEAEQASKEAEIALQEAKTAEEATTKAAEQAQETARNKNMSSIEQAKKLATNAQQIATSSPKAEEAVKKVQQAAEKVQQAAEKAKTEANNKIETAEKVRTEINKNIKSEEETAKKTKDEEAFWRIEKLANKLISEDYLKDKFATEATEEVTTALEEAQAAFEEAKKVLEEA